MISFFRCRWLVGTPDLSDWLHFWKLKHGSKGEGFDPAIHFKVRHKQHWTPDRGPGEHYSAGLSSGQQVCRCQSEEYLALCTGCY